MIKFIGSDGTGVSLKMVNAETGEDVSKLVAAKYGGTIALDQIITARMEVYVAEIEITAHETAWHTKHPVTGKYGPLAALHFRDGSRVEFDERGVPILTKAEAGGSGGT